MGLRRSCITLCGAALLVAFFLVGSSSPAGAGGEESCTGDVVVALDVRLKARAGHDTWRIPLATPLPPGEWSVQTRSADRGDDREGDHQPNEQWLLEIVGHATLGPTTDLPDGVAATAVVDDLGTFTSDSGVEALVVRHLSPSPDTGPNSVDAVCVGFSRVTAPPSSTTVPPSVPPSSTTVPPSVPPSSTTVPPSVPPSSTTVPPSVPPSSTTVPPSVPPSSTTVPPSPPPSVPPSPPPVPPAPPSPPPVPPAPPSPVPSVAARAELDCTSRRVVVVLDNRGDAGATVDLALPRADLQGSIEVGAGQTTTTSLALGDLEDVDTEVRVFDALTGELEARAPLSVDCAAPAAPRAELEVDCTAGVVRVRLGNDGGEPVGLTVLHERVARVAEVVVPPGGHDEVDVAVDGRGSVPVRVVTAAGIDVLRATADTTCGPSAPPAGGPTTTDDSGGVGAASPEVDVVVDCASVALALAEPVPITVEIDGAVALYGSATGDIEVPVVPGVPSRVVVGDPDDAGAVVVTPSPQGCAQARAVVRAVCAEGTASVEVERAGTGRERFVVLVDGRIGGVIEIDGSAAASVPVALGEGDEVMVARSAGTLPATGATVPCPARDGPAGAVAASLLVVAVVSTAVGAFAAPRPLRIG